MQALRGEMYRLASMLPAFDMDKKRSGGKHYYVYMVAGAAKFLRTYYAKVKEHLAMMEYSC